MRARCPLLPLANTVLGTACEVSLLSIAHSGRLAHSVPGRMRLHVLLVPLCLKPHPRLQCMALCADALQVMWPFK